MIPQSMDSPSPNLALPLNSTAISNFIATNEQANPGASTAISELNSSAGLFMQDYRSNLAAGMSDANAVTAAVNHAFAMSPGA